MDRKQSIVANVRYLAPKDKGPAKLKGILRYVQYRDDRDGHIPQEFGLQRWVDHGLGDNHQTISANCERLHSAHVQAFTLVINPNPELLAFVAPDDRPAFVNQLTEETMESFFAARGLETPEYAYVQHRRATQQEGLDNPHTHVFLPGTYHSWADGDRIPLYFNQNRKERHIDLLHEVAQGQMAQLMERYVGPDWEQRFDAQQALKAQSLTPEPDPTPVDDDIDAPSITPSWTMDL